jgi:hypothetical protein
MRPDLERWLSGRKRSPAKGVYVNSVSRVRIPLSPPDQKRAPQCGAFFGMAERERAKRSLVVRQTAKAALRDAGPAHPCAPRQLGIHALCSLDLKMLRNPGSGRRIALHFRHTAHSFASSRSESIPHSLLNSHRSRGLFLSGGGCRFQLTSLRYEFPFLPGTGSGMIPIVFPVFWHCIGV